MSPEAVFSINNGFLLLICGLFSLIVPFGSTQQRSGSKSEQFSCPEDFGYYPHPSDCSQYFVCVFGDPLLESCTGGLMYSHDLRTCDWPRNVGCGVTAATSSKNENNAGISSGNVHSAGRQRTTTSWRQEIPEPQNDEIPDKNLYEEEDLGPAEEVESDRQQRVYRGQPPTLGQVARDRDGIIRHANALQTSSGIEKVKPIAVVSFGSHHQSLRPLSSVPSYIVEDSQSSVPTTSKSIFNVTKTDPFYSVYDDNQEIYRNSEIDQFHKQRKQPTDFQIIQNSHRLQPHSSSSLNNPTIYSNQDYRQQSEIDDESQQSDKLISSKGRGRGSVTYSPGGNEFIDGATASSGRSRPTLKPSTSIVTKSEAVDIYKYAPKRPDNVYPTPQPDKAAAKCRKDICLLPDCNCGGKDIPGDLTPEETPQMVLLTFDDSVNELNRGLYVDLFEKGRVNPNGCPISATFYVSHEWTDYSMVQNLYAAGHEMASHSVSHSFGEQFSQRKWTKEIVGQREILSAYGGVRQEDIRGMRAPFLAVGGNKMFKMLYDANFTYDSSMPIYENRPPSWPYTMDYKLFHDCMIPPCPTRSYPGVWEIPMVMWQDLNGGRCSMGDACSNPPTADGVYKMLIKNFERHFSTNRAPFGLFYHSSWFTQPHHKEGFIAFLDTIVNMPEVWLVTNWQVIQWVRDPTPISRLNKFSPFNCDYPERPRRCNNAKVCNLWHKSGVRYLKTCQACPDVYPWTGKTGVRNSRIDIEEPPSTE